MIPLDLHTHCVVWSMGSGSASINAPNVANHTLKISAGYSTLVKLLKIGELLRKRDREELEKEITEIGGIPEIRLEVVREEGIEVMTGVVSLQNMIRETSHLNLLETESRK